jgi:hypothetical protein
MSDTLGRIPPPDPQAGARARQAAQRRTTEGVVFVALLFGQLLLAFAAGAWAASGWIDAGDLAGYAATGMLLVLLGAHALGYGALLLFGGVAMLALVPRLFRRRAPAQASSERDGAPDRIGRALLWLVIAVHGVAVQCGALVLCFILAASSDAADIAAWWRFSLAALLLGAVTARVMLAWARSEAT